MTSQVFCTTISLMKDNQVVYMITIESINSYLFNFDSKYGANLSIKTFNLSIKDLNMLIDKSYDCYVLMAKKKIIKNDNEQVFTIPAKAYKKMMLIDDGEEVILNFIEK